MPVRTLVFPVAARRFCRALFLAAVCSGMAAIMPAAPVAESGEHVLFHEDFGDVTRTDWGTLPAGWWLEGEAAGARARVDGGRLVLDATRTGRGGALWFDQELPDDIEVSFDVHVLDAVKQANNMNLLLGFRDPRGSGLRETRDERPDGRYNHYYSDRLTGIIVTYLANGDPEAARLRVRQVPPFNPVLAEYRGYHARQGQTYRFVLTRDGDRLTCAVDGRVLLDVVLPARTVSQADGYLGFRTWNTLLWWDNLVIRQPARSRRAPPT